jgi:hypothetical protein
MRHWRRFSTRRQQPENEQKAQELREAARKVVSQVGRFTFNDFDQQEREVAENLAAKSVLHLACEDRKCLASLHHRSLKEAAENQAAKLKEQVQPRMTPSRSPRHRPARHSIVNSVHSRTALRARSPCSGEVASCGADSLTAGACHLRS